MELGLKTQHPQVSLILSLAVLGLQFLTATSWDFDFLNSNTTELYVW